MLLKLVTMKEGVIKKLFLYLIGATLVCSSIPISTAYAADINLQSWKITLPICDGDEAKEVRQPELNTLSNEWFKKTAEGLDFYVNSKGACTTGGSENPRSELREMNADGSNEYNWDPSKGTHRMIIRQKVTELAVQGDSAGVVIGQIHDVGKDIDDYTVFRLEGKTLYAFVDGKKSKSKVIDSNFPLNQEISLGFSVENNAVKFLYDRNGGAQPPEVHSVPYPGGSEGAYFKAGNYCQCGKDGRSGSTRVIITGLGVSHDGSFPDIGGSSGNPASATCDPSAYDESFFGSNDILYYNPCASPDVCRASSSFVVGGDNAEKAFNFFTGRGLTPEQAAGLVGNLKAESGVLPGRVQGTSPNEVAPDNYIPKDKEGFGIAQWTYGGEGAAGTPPYKGRQGGLISLAESKGLKITDLGLQLEYVWQELSPGGARAAAGEELRKTVTIADASDVVLIKFESPADQGQSVKEHRRQLSNDVFGKYSGNTGVSTQNTEPITSNLSSCSNSLTGSGDIVAIAQAELEKGVKEDPIGCDDANTSQVGDCGPEVNKYTDNRLEYWCADFVSWVFKEAGKAFTGGSSGGWRIASVSSLRDWFKENGKYTVNGPSVTPNPGDVYIVADSSHTGIVEKVENDTVYTISGNTAVDNISNGTGVGRGSYKVGSSVIAGYGSLK